MDTNKKDTVPQRRAKQWKEILLYHELRQGPKKEDTEGKEWLKTLEKLHKFLIEDEGNRRQLTRYLVHTYPNTKGTKEEYLKEVITSSQLMGDYIKADPGHKDHRRDELEKMGL